MRSSDSDPEEGETQLRTVGAAPQPTVDEEETAFRPAESIHDEVTRIPQRASSIDDAVSPDPPDGAEQLRAGSRLRNRYVLHSPLGQGAMGQVWKAKDLFSEEANEKNPWVAIKLFLGHVERLPNAFAAMHREASRTQKLAHPNIVTVHTLDRDERTGKAFIAMELLEGEPLDRLIKGQSRERTLGMSELWSIATGMAEGLAYAHRRGFIHADFKPGNVFVTREGIPKILDFGIARAVRLSDDAELSSEADDSVVSGYTPNYASPEVLADQHPHTADDVFAWGLVTYELLAGRHPFDRRPSSEAASRGIKVPPIKGISRQSWRVIERALEFDRAARWPDAGALLRALQLRTGLKKALVASVTALLLTAGGLTYKNYQDRQPSVPLSHLPAEQQRQVRQALAEGNEALRYVRENQLIEASADAADRFADAYAIHVRNPDAVAGLEAAADLFIGWWEQQADQQQAVAELRKFQQKSEYYQGYRPLQSAIRRAERPK